MNLPFSHVDEVKGRAVDYPRASLHRPAATVIRKKCPRRTVHPDLNELGAGRVPGDRRDAGLIGVRDLESVIDRLKSRPLRRKLSVPINPTREEASRSRIGGASECQKQHLTWSPGLHQRRRSLLGGFFNQIAFSHCDHALLEKNDLRRFLPRQNLSVTSES